MARKRKPKDEGVNKKVMERELSEEKIELLDVTLIDPPVLAARDVVDPEKVRELAESIRENGLQQPIKVRPMNGRYEIVYGHRRVLAHRILGWPTIKAVVEKLGDHQVLFLRLLENIQRENLNPIETGKMYDYFKSELGLSLSEVARKVGKPETTVLNYLKILQVPEEFHKAIADRSVAMTTMLRLLDIDEPEIRSYYMKAAVENGATEATARMWVEDFKKSRVGKYYGEPGGEGWPGLESSGEPVYRACACCLGPVDVRTMVTVQVCRKCEREIRGALSDKK